MLQLSDDICGLLWTHSMSFFMAPELDAVLHVGSYESRAEWDSPLPCPAGHSSVGAVQDTVALLGCKLPRVNLIKKCFSCLTLILSFATISCSLFLLTAVSRLQQQKELGWLNKNDQLNEPDLQSSLKTVKTNVFSFQRVNSNVFSLSNVSLSNHTIFPSCTKCSQEAIHHLNSGLRTNGFQQKIIFLHNHLCHISFTEVMAQQASIATDNTERTRHRSRKYMFYCTRSFLFSFTNISSDIYTVYYTFIAI